MSTLTASIPAPGSGGSVSVPSTHSVIDALLREYMKRKGMKAAVADFDAENPRDETSISQLSVLVKTLGITREYKENKRQPEPLDTILELVCHRFGASETKQALGDTAPTSTPTPAPIPNPNPNSNQKPKPKLDSAAKQESVPCDCDRVQDKRGEDEASAGADANARPPQPQPQPQPQPLKPRIRIETEIVSRQHASSTSSPSVSTSSASSLARRSIVGANSSRRTRDARSNTDSVQTQSPNSGTTPKREWVFDQSRPAAVLDELSPSQFGRQGGGGTPAPRVATPRSGDAGTGTGFGRGRAGCEGTDPGASSVQMPSWARAGEPRNATMNSSNVGKYHVGMQVEGLAGGTVKGWVVAVRAAEGSLGGEVEIAMDPGTGADGAGIASSSTPGPGDAEQSDRSVHAAGAKSCLAPATPAALASTPAPAPAHGADRRRVLGSPRPVTATGTGTATGTSTDGAADPTCSLAPLSVSSASRSLAPLVAPAHLTPLTPLGAPAAGTAASTAGGASDVDDVLAAAEQMLAEGSGEADDLYSFD